MLRRFLRPSVRSLRIFRPCVQELEDRCLLAAPVVDPLAVSLNIPVNKSLIVPFAATDPDGGGVTWSVSSSNPQVQVVPHTDNTYLELEVASYGTLEFQLFNDLAPNTAALIGGFAQGEFYDGLTFHRISNGFMIQGGDPLGTGSGGPGYDHDDEFHPQAIFSGSGQLAMANSGKDTNGSQFFITEGPQRFLDFNHTIFGQLVRGFDVLEAISAAPVEPRDPNNPNSERSKPNPLVVITAARVVQNHTDAVFTLVASGAAAGATTTLTVTATSSTGGSTTGTFQAQVVTGSNDPPILGPVSDQVSANSDPVTIHLTHTDLESDPVIFDAAVLSPNTDNATVTTTRNADGSADVVVTRTAGFTGPVQVLVGVMQQGATNRGSTSYPWDIQVITVAFGDEPISLADAGSVNFVEGARGNETLGILTDADPTGVPADFQVRINWGDGTSLDSTGQVVLDGGKLKVVGTHTYREAGAYPVHVLVTDVHHSIPGGDNGGATANLRLTAIVVDAPPPPVPTPPPAYVPPPPPPPSPPPSPLPSKHRRKQARKKPGGHKPLLKRVALKRWAYRVKKK